MSDTFTDANIDPQIRAMNPAAQLLQMVRTRAATAPPQGSPSGGSEDDEFMDQDLPANPPLQSAAYNSIGNSSTLVSFGRLLKRQFKLSNQSSVAFDQFCQTGSSDERQAILFAYILELIDLGRKNDKAEAWTISPGLSQKINMYVQAFVFSPTTTAYWGLKSVEHLVKAMRECKVADLPNEEETTQNEIVVVKVRGKMTYHRNVQVKNSTEKNSETRNIAALANKVLSGTTIKPTVQFYQRLAFLRWCVREYPNLPEDDYWPKVDEIINTYRTDCQSKIELDLVFNAIYEDDKRKYGDPSETDFTTEDIQADPKWQVTVCKHSENVRPVLKKRKISEVEEGGDNDSQGGDIGGEGEGNGGEGGD
ncbi:hypothetical protein B0H10DRAFT_1928643 [Mycena sp. CBHHK59/15]|nr:hypothetical protein B0H10DRAFT_1928643 [Mycena sp. CBHHK59/15]